MRTNVEFALSRDGQRPQRGGSRQHFNIVVAGEFNSGKSSVINTLLRQQALPATVGASEMPPIKIFPSERSAYTIVDRDNALVDPGLFQSGKAKGAGLRSALVELPLPQFRGASITEVGIGVDGKLSPEMREALLSADMLVWCTMAQRAWCLTEITLIESLPAELLEGAVLAVTRADYLQGEAQRELVRSRLAREAGKFFDGITLIDASPAAIGGASDDATWASSGGESLFAQVMARFAASDKYGLEPAIAELECLQSFRQSSAPAAPEPAEAPRRNPAEVADLWCRELDAISVWMSRSASENAEGLISGARDRVRRFAEAHLEPGDGQDGARAALGRLFEYRLAQIEALAARHEPDVGLMLTVDLLCQIEEEVAFSR